MRMPATSVALRCLLAALAALACRAGAQGRANDTAVPIVELKAALVFSFTKFVTWPAGRFAAPDAALEIGLFCPDEYRQALAAIARGRPVAGHPVSARTLDSEAEARQAHAVFVCASHEHRLEPVLHAVRGAPVLVVSESARFAALEGMLNIVERGDRLRFQVNVAAAERAGLRLSAQLQKLAIGEREEPR